MNGYIRLNGLEITRPHYQGSSPYHHRVCTFDTLEDALSFAISNLSLDKKMGLRTKAEQEELRLRMEMKYIK